MANAPKSQRWTVEKVKGRGRWRCRYYIGNAQHVYCGNVLHGSEDAAVKHCAEMNHEPEGSFVGGAL